MCKAAAAALSAVLLACGSPTASGPPQPQPPPATPAELSSYYGSYSAQAGDVVVIARLGWFFDMQTSDYRTIYDERPPDEFSIGCEFHKAIPKCADLRFTSGTLVVTDASRKTTVRQRIHQRQTDVMIPAAGALLAGTITEAVEAPPRAGIVIVHGAERGERYFYDIWVGIYTTLGLDVLTYDKRGSGASSGLYPGEFPTEEALNIYADDATAALGSLAARPGMAGGKVGFHGGSQGGWTVPLAISRHHGASFAVLVSAPATTVDQTDLWAGFTGGGQSTPSQSDDQMLAAVRATHSGYDPAPALQSLSVPTLWVLGTNDRTVPTSVCVDILSGFNKPNFQVQRVPTGHALLVNRTGLLADDDRSPGLAPQLVPTMRAWFKALS